MRIPESILNFNSSAWQLVLTGLLLLFAFVAGQAGLVSGLEYGLFEYISSFNPARGEGGNEPVSPVPAWVMLIVYTAIFAIYFRQYTRRRTTAVSIIPLIIILFSLLMLEIVLAVFGGIFVPVLLPIIVMVIMSSAYWLIDIYHRFVALTLVGKNPVSLLEVRESMAAGDLKSALIYLKQCPTSDELLETGYELGILLEASKRWASALNLYHWLSQYDPGMTGFITRVEEIRKNKGQIKEGGATDQALHQIGNYRIVKKIARGSTADVYEGYDLRTHNRVAVKVMSSRLDDSSEGDRIRHWLHEAEIVSQLDHPNIAKIHDAAIFNDIPYIAMDYISGHSMALRLRKCEYITVGECIRISKAVLSALDEAHRNHVIHGDIKPANIMYDDREKTYIVTDFGAAYTRSGVRPKENIIVGTPSYMSPEQLEGRKLDGRSDLFSLAVTLYHLLTGHQPFTGQTLPQLKRSIINDNPELDHLTLPAGIMEVIMKALQKKPYMRFADARQMLSAVEYCEAQLRDRLSR